MNAQGIPTAVATNCAQILFVEKQISNGYRDIRSNNDETSPEMTMILPVDPTASLHKNVTGYDTPWVMRLKPRLGCVSTCVVPLIERF